MEQRLNDALLKDARIKFRKEECVLSMVQRSNNARAKDVQTKPCKEEYALSMGHSESDAAVKDVQTKPIDEVYAEGTGHIAIHKMNLLHLDQNTTRLLQLNQGCDLGNRAIAAHVRYHLA